MIVTYYPSSKNIHNLKDTKLCLKKIQSIFQIFKSPLPHVNGLKYAWHTKKSFNLWYKRKKPKAVSIFSYDSKLW
jgi:hypothetical protein